VNFEEFFDEWVTFGRRLDESGFLEGHVRTGPGHEIYKLKRGGDILFSASMGNSRFRMLGGAALYAAEDGYMYYSPAEGWFDQDEAETGVLTIRLCGPYEIHALGVRNLLDCSAPPPGVPRFGSRVKRIERWWMI
jgi:hypothetical protein